MLKKKTFQKITSIVVLEFKHLFLPGTKKCITFLKSLNVTEVSKSCA